MHARRSFYGRPRYDILEVHPEGDPNPWFGRALAFFDVRVEAGTWQRMVLIQWLERVATHVPGADTFTYWSSFPDVVPLGSVVRHVRMVTSPKSAGEDGEATGGDSDSGSPCFVLLPYGRVNNTH